MQFQKKTLFWLGQEVMIAVTVSAVALSLGGAFGSLSGRGVVFGMLAAAVYPLITSAFGGTKIQCSGPTGPMTTMFIALAGATAASLAGQSEATQIGFMNMTIFLSGIVLLLAAVCRIGSIVSLVPSVIISGFMDGIALIIWISQAKKLLQIGTPVISGPVLINISVAVVTTLLIFVLSAALKQSSNKWLSFVSATFVTLVVMTIACTVLRLPIEESSGQVPLHSFAELYSFLQQYAPTGWPWQFWLLALPWALQLAGVAYIDSLLTSRIVDAHTNTTSKPNKELCAQAIATGAVACIGGIPGAQATERSMLMVKEGARSRISGVLVGVFAFVMLFVFKDVISSIPKAVFAGILFKLGYDVFDWKPFTSFWSLKNKSDVQWYHLGLITLTALLSVSTNIIIGISVGSLVFSALRYKNKTKFYDLIILKNTEGLSDEP